MSGLYLFGTLIVSLLAIDAFVIRPLERLATPFTRRKVHRLNGRVVNGKFKRLN